MTSFRATTLFLAGLSVLLVAACTLSRSDGIDATTLPDSLQADYGLFAQRCSKCHSLARPLGSGIDDDDYWFRYVERMRRMPSSGISVADEAPILRFLHYYSLQQKRPKDVPVVSDGGVE